jgi:hypothetical protein
MSYAIRSHLDAAKILDLSPAQLDQLNARLLSGLTKKARQGYGVAVEGVPAVKLPAKPDLLLRLITQALDPSLSEPVSGAAAGHLLLDPVVLPLPDPTTTQPGLKVRRVALVRSLRCGGEIRTGIGLLRVSFGHGPDDADIETNWYSDIHAAGDQLEDLYLLETRRKGLPKGRSSWWIGGDARQPGVPPDWENRIKAMCAVAGFEVDIKLIPGDPLLVKSLRDNTPEVLIEWRRYTKGKPQALVEAFAQIRSAGHLPIPEDMDFDAALRESRRALRAYDPPAEVVGRIPGSVLEAVLMAQEKYGSGLVFLESALASAGRSVFSRPHEVLRYLEIVGRVVEAWRDGEVAGGGFGRAFEDLGLSCFVSGMSKTAREEFAEDYKRTHNGSDIMLDPHLKIGTNQLTGIRIYWWVDRESKVFVVGHVGEKLRDKSKT